MVVAGEAPAGGDLHEGIGGAVLVGVADAGELGALADDDAVGVVGIDEESRDLVQAGGKARPRLAAFSEAPDFPIAGAGVDGAVLGHVESGDIETGLGRGGDGLHRVSCGEEIRIRVEGSDGEE